MSAVRLRTVVVVVVLTDLAACGALLSQRAVYQQRLAAAATTEVRDSCGCDGDPGIRALRCAGRTTGGAL